MSYLSVPLSHETRDTNRTSQNLSYPPAQTVCDAADTETYFYQGPAHTNYEISYVTYYTYATVWVG